jgi:coenzyme Q-binding protein COQ10
MAVHQETRRLGYSPQQLFELISEVEHYPEFLPLWREVRISRTASLEKGKSTYYTDQTIQIGPFTKRFQTKTLLDPYCSIHITSSDALFRQFSINWLLSEEKNSSSNVNFSLNCVAASPLLRPIFDLALMESARSIVSTFEHRAKMLYGS